MPFFGAQNDGCIFVVAHNNWHFFFCLVLDRPTSLTPLGRVAEPFATGPETKRRQFCNGSSLSVRNFFEGN